MSICLIGLFDFMKNAGKYQQYEISDISAKIDSRLESPSAKAVRFPTV
mgnify:CR=1 FL=1